MVSERKRQYIFGGIITAAVIAFIISLFALMSHTNLKDISMDPGTDGIGWSYELISGSQARAAAPEIIDEFTVSFPGESCRAVRMSRTITEEMELAQVGIYLYDAMSGVDILLDGEMIYTSFSGAPRDEAGLVADTNLKPAASEKTEVYLPKDYIGRTLTVVTYFPSETSEIIPVFPYLCSDETIFAVTSVENVLPVFRITLCAILAFLTAFVYVLDISNGRADKRILLLTLFYVMLTAEQAFMCVAGSYSLLTEKLNMFDFVCELYIAPLLLFAASHLTSWRRWTLASATGAWFIFDFIRLMRSRIINGPFFGKASAPVVLILYLLAIAMIIVEMRLKKVKRPRKDYIIYACIAAAAAALRIFTVSAQWEGNIGMYLEQLIVEPLRGYFYPLLLFFSSVGAVTATAAVIIEFVRRTLHERELVNVLAEQNRYAMEGYKRMAEAEETTYSVRHEMRHHMLALLGMLRDGSVDRARDYIASVTEEYDDLPTGQYSKNVMVNIIAGAYLERAAAKGITTKYSLNLPETLPIADTDLCVFLTNMFENALNACEVISVGNERYIRVKMYINGRYLFIGCENSADYSKEENKRAGHGYGLENMRRIAEKYDGVLKIDKNGSSFSLKSSFCLNGSNK